jgi:RNA polymerase sigma-70 factor (ECF subfamily)
MTDAFARDSESDLDRIEALYRAHADFVHGAVLRLGGPTMDADDLTHEVFLVALRKWSRLPPGADARAWLYGVAARAVSAARRKARWRRRLGRANPPLASQWTDPELGTDPFRRDARATVYRLIERMSEKKRAVFLLFEIEGLSGEEIAELVRAPLKTVWTRLYHARREFLKALDLERERQP